MLTTAWIGKRTSIETLRPPQLFHDACAYDGRG